MVNDEGKTLRTVYKSDRTNQYSEMHKNTALCSTYPPSSCLRCLQKVLNFYQNTRAIFTLSREINWTEFYVVETCITKFELSE